MTTIKLLCSTIYKWLWLRRKELINNTLDLFCWFYFWWHVNNSRKLSQISSKLIFRVFSPSSSLFFLYNHYSSFFPMIWDVKQMVHICQEKYASNPKCPNFTHIEYKEISHVKKKIDLGKFVKWKKYLGVFCREEKLL